MIFVVLVIICIAAVFIVAFVIFIVLIIVSEKNRGGALLFVEVGFVLVKF